MIDRTNQSGKPFAQDPAPGAASASLESGSASA